MIGCDFSSLTILFFFFLLQCHIPGVFLWNNTHMMSFINLFLHFPECSILSLCCQVLSTTLFLLCCAPPGHHRPTLLKWFCSPVIQLEGLLSAIVHHQVINMAITANRAHNWNIWSGLCWYLRALVAWCLTLKVRTIWDFCDPTLDLKILTWNTPTHYWHSFCVFWFDQDISRKIAGKSKQANSNCWMYLGKC